MDSIGRTFSLRAMNLEPITLYRETIAGTSEQVEEVEHIATDRVAAIGNENPDKHIPDHLTDLWAGLRGTLTDEQHSKVRGLLTEHQRTFAVSKEDIGRTHLVQHEILTGDAESIRQNQRRLPFAKRDCAREI